MFSLHYSRVSLVSYNISTVTNSLFKDLLLLFHNYCPSVQENSPTVHHPTFKSICVLLFKVRDLLTAASSCRSKV